MGYQSIGASNNLLIPHCHGELPFPQAFPPLVVFLSLIPPLRFYHQLPCTYVYIYIYTALWSSSITLIVWAGQQGVEASDHDHNVKVDGDDHDLVYSFYPTKLFVFGDSYSDTGNTNKSKSYKCWKYPYGVTFPGKPTGRFSDGRVFTDYLGTFSHSTYISYLFSFFVSLISLAFFLNWL